MSGRIGVVSDIHGNQLALEAVVEDIEKKQINTVLNLGDSLYGPLDPGGTFRLISNKNFISISGNQDRFILENRQKTNDLNSTLTFVLESLSTDAFDWLAKLEKEKVWRNIYMCHGNFHQDDVPLVEKFEEGELRIKTTSELEIEVKKVVQDVILCGHTHVPRISWLNKTEKCIINPGSVGLPAYDDDFPFYHKMESGSPFAKYVILEMDGNKVISISQQHLRYDYERAAKQAEGNGRSDWAHWIMKGKVK